MHSSFRIFAVHLRKPFLIDLSRSLPRLLLFASKLQRQYHMVSGTSEYLWKDFVCVTLNPPFYKILIIPPPSLADWKSIFFSHSLTLKLPEVINMELLPMIPTLNSPN